MTVASVKSHFTGWRHWEANPVVIKELRQSVRSWAVTGMLMLFLVVLFVTTLINLIESTSAYSPSMQIGRDIFQTFMGILSGASILFIPLYTGVRMAAERQENNTDLLYISTLSPFRIIRGKVICGAYITVLFFSACMPFMAFTNLLRGIDLPTVFFLLLCLFVVVCSVNQLAIFIACLPISRIFKLLVGLVGLVAALYIAAGVIAASNEMVLFGIGSMMGRTDFWLTTGTVAGIVLMADGLLFVLSVALISPPSANRALPVRIYVTLIWLAGGLLAADWAIRERESATIFIWIGLSTYLLLIALVVVISNNDLLSHRVRRQIPKFRVLRPLAFLFYNGAAGGLVWVAAMAIVTYFLPRAHSGFGPEATGFEWDAYRTYLQIYPPLFVYAFAYALTGLYIHRQFFSRRPAKIAGVITLLLFSLVAIGEAAVLFCANDLSWQAIDRLQLGNAANLFMVSTPEDRKAHLYFALGWLVIAIIFNALWFVRQGIKFRPPERIKPVIAP